MLGRRQGEVAPTREVALKIEMPPLRPTGAKPTLWHPALTSCRIRAAGLLSPSWSIECRGSALKPGPARLTRLEGWSARGRAGRRAKFPRRIKRSTIRFALQGL